MGGAESERSRWKSSWNVLKGYPMANYTNSKTNSKTNSNSNSNSTTSTTSTTSIRRRAARIQ